MPANRESLLAGRHPDPLDDHGVRRATMAFLELDARAPVRYEPGARTQFRVNQEDQTAEIVFGSDIYPGRAIVDPNSALSLLAAAAHELAHWRRWQDQREIVREDLYEIDEALTSLEAIQRFAGKLTEQDVRLLVADAVQRLQLYVQRLTAQ